ncbi:hypothetical protein BGW36DRAFT_307388 [Talaromyces proteolyticus]|uniref:Azaphilone pigments biosynthesis cluster protein L N-terminal domain-containing protein n=1 Tax=Talaromyces proteolyticus TaxID=1131652 RepID=A0AAD4KER1_9EURO|nr:uncharacterized protein BGW36DRAFT_307388 [Talaromyces proteolyticus]KAH8689924.1 hypothetical protein BGW36DRAFT_307388 [Talaromyces proteolyticus]
MADPLSITAGVLAVTTAAVQATKSLYETVKRFRDRDKTLRRLQNELEDLVNILTSLTEIIYSEASMLALLRDPIDRCSQVCREFEESMKCFSGKSKTGFRDWTKLEFRRGDINEFIDIIAGYKSTISIGVGTITMQTSKISHKVLEEYNEMVQDTAYNLEINLQRIDEKLARLVIDKTSTSEIKVDLTDERAVTQQCIRICEDAKTYIESLTHKQSSLFQEAPKSSTGDDPQNRFEAQIITHQALNGNREGFVEVIERLRKRLETLILNGDNRDEDERLRLQEDINISKQCLEVCKVATEMSNQKIYRIGEVIADGDSDQVVVTTLADLFDIKKALSKGNSAQLVGSMAEESLQLLTEKRYASRFGALQGPSGPAKTVTTNPTAVFDTRMSRNASSPRTGNTEQSAGSEAGRPRPSPNENKKRAMSSDSSKP